MNKLEQKMKEEMKIRGHRMYKNARRKENAMLVLKSVVGALVVYFLLVVVTAAF
jgi:hypothetical protein